MPERSPDFTPSTNLHQRGQNEVKTLLAKERRAQIAALVAQKGTVRVNELSAHFRVSEVTIRNDLDLLDEQGVLVRDRGGAVALTHSSLFIAFNQRVQLNLDEKRRIGYAAAKLVNPHETIIMDAGTTLLEMARNLNRELPITVVTNALNVAEHVGALSGAHVLMLGGSLVPETLSTVGPEAEHVLGNLVVDKVFLGTQAIDPINGLLDTSTVVARVKRAMIQAARQVIVLADSSKWGRSAFARIIPLSKVHIIVSDVNLPQNARDIIAESGVQLILV